MSCHSFKLHKEFLEKGANYVRFEYAKRSWKNNKN